MKKILWILLLITNTLTVKAQQDIITEFSPSSFSDWEYSRPNHVLSTEGIIQYKVILYKVSESRDYTLTSPQIDISGHDNIIVEFDWKATNFDQPSYSILKGAPVIELINSENKVISTVSCRLPEATLIQTINASIAVPKNVTSEVRLRLSAPKADVNNTGAVKNIKVSAGIKAGVNDIEQSKSRIIVEKNAVVITNVRSKSIKITEATTGRLLHTIQNSLDDEIRITTSTKGVHVITIDRVNHKVML